MSGTVKRAVFAFGPPVEFIILKSGARLFTSDLYCSKNFTRAGTGFRVQSPL